MPIFYLVPGIVTPLFFVLNLDQICSYKNLGQIQNSAICDRLWDFGPYGGTWAKLGFLYNLKCSSVLGILLNF